RHGDISPETREHITQKAEKLLNYFERVTSIDVTIDFAGDRVTTEIIVDAEHKHDFVASDTHEYVADDARDEVKPTFDRTLHKMEQQIRKYKEKLQDHRRDRPVAELGESAEEESPIE
ncbi:MAG: ribosome-associated translation inhibitor RaiA, partial [Planctomycetaceae bacterium]